MTTIMLVEDDEILRENFSELLRDEHFDVETYSDIQSAQARFNQPLPDLVILDITLGKDTDAGFQLCAELRKRCQSIPIIFFTSHDSDFDKISGMRLGVDDYLTKNVSFDYLVVRIKALIKRIRVLSGSKTEKAVKKTSGELMIDLDTFSAYWKGQKLDISLTQLWMLQSLIDRPGHVRSHEQLMQAANVVVEHNTVTAHIKNLRVQFQKVDPMFSSIKTERGFGYRWAN